MLGVPFYGMDGTRIVFATRVAAGPATDAGRWAMRRVLEMDDGVCIRVWMRDGVPARLRQAARLAEVGEGVIVEFVAHVPAAVVADRAYRRWNEKSGAEGWMLEGQLGLFGTNALDVYPHPDGDGILIVGSCV